MTSLTILWIVGLAAIAALLACLRGFSHALRHRKVSGVFLSFEDSQGWRPAGKTRGQVDFPQRRAPRQVLAPGQVSSSTAALVEMVILLGSRSVRSDLRAAALDSKVARLRQRMKVRRSGVQPLSNS